MKSVLIFQAKLLRAARFFVIYFTSVAEEMRHAKEKNLVGKKMRIFFGSGKKEEKLSGQPPKKRPVLSRLSSLLGGCKWHVQHAAAQGAGVL